MKKFNPLTIFTMLGIFLFLGGCQKEENATSTIKIHNSHNNGIGSNLQYKPFFNIGDNNNFAAGDSLNIKAPSYGEYAEMIHYLKNVSYKSSLGQMMLKLHTDGHKFIGDYAIKHSTELESVFVIYIPVITHTGISSILRYSRTKEKISFELIDVNTVRTFVKNNPIPESNELSEKFGTVSTLSIFEYYLFNAIDSDLHSWIQQNHTKADRIRSGDRCVVLITISFEYIDRGNADPESWAIVSSTVQIETPCGGGAGFGEGIVYYSNTDDNYGGVQGGGSSGTSESGNAADKEVTDTYPNVDRDCIESLSTEFKGELVSYGSMYNPCDDVSIIDQITEIINRECIVKNADNEEEEASEINVFEQIIQKMELERSISGKIANLMGFGNTLDQTTPPLSVNNRLCPNSIIIKPNDSDPKKNVAGITGLQVSLNNGNTILSFNKIWFNVDHTRDCGIPTENLISQAINNAIQIADQRLNLGLPINESNSDLVQNVQFLRLIENQIKQIALAEGCQPKITTAENSQAHNIQTIYAVAIPGNYTNSLGKDSHCGAQFVDFSNMQTGCP
jgi:hypothetical protein